MQTNKLICRLGAIGSLAIVSFTSTIVSADYPNVESGPVFDERGRLLQPSNFREGVFIGAPLTPHALNDGKAGFPEFHNVYVDRAAYRHFQRTGEWPEGTVLVKELQLVKKGTFDDGSRLEASGRGYFPDEPNGLDVSVKDSRRFAATDGWGFFNFGHHAPPYASAAEVAPAEACAACHQANAHDDMVFSDFYRQLTPLPTPAMP
ncbi:cytochrome P460 family protein [Thiosocius teredinicola]|uniref:cytochrome P460 family protein n=1 Tax=Thiosocius teredinicola TaxID=1973002 RepID=UPI000991442C